MPITFLWVYIDKDKYEVHSGTPSKVAEVNVQRVILKYYVLPNGQVKISDARVITEEGSWYGVLQANIWLD